MRQILRIRRVAREMLLLGLLLMLQRMLLLMLLRLRLLRRLRLRLRRSLLLKHLLQQLLVLRLLPIRIHGWRERVNWSQISNREKQR